MQKLSEHECFVILQKKIHTSISKFNSQTMAPRFYPTKGPRWRKSQAKAEREKEAEAKGSSSSEANVLRIRRKAGTSSRITQTPEQRDLSTYPRTRSQTQCLEKSRQEVELVIGSSSTVNQVKVKPEALSIVNNESMDEEDLPNKRVELQAIENSLTFEQYVKNVESRKQVLAAKKKAEEEGQNQRIKKIYWRGLEIALSDDDDFHHL